ncbi:MAG: twin-arginine translocase TatA/TatE family subunit [Dehalococcoides mccartyi]|jgi:Sec-independent protein secretion pathway components|uniref:Twin-arginine translocase TatA/TatE family subunit n=2 Tax=root TaxID=1 RepID=A0AB38Z9P1_9CHLR|nr:MULTISPECIES: twin-arginine translocase TatA/TatE family subunit [Dehalococcoides]MBF4482438.1 twin-arginine translocase TatA/TatE family subunit [Dehalococcoides mccartyi]MBJ7531598.1 twin-arginine translocase TatA/TatE family subunit [Dehalococcoides mccartyi]MDP4279564.1 twin-arginine translocase TatA/TatE family subunit [Dehalococcoides mccartyi]MDP4279571.1 twin-arginine translocase TatA/TatE family subunit [Dehalococcoides mccartyi]MEA4878769.1 twin-arginine translocase TatA/TatE fami
MDFLGIGFGEIIIVLIVATLIFGPGKIPEFARQIGQFVNSFRKVTSEMTRDFTRAIDAENLASPGKKKTGSGSTSTSSKSKSLENFLNGPGSGGKA